MRTVVLTLTFTGLMVLAGAGLLGYVWTAREAGDDGPSADVANPLRIASIAGLRPGDGAHVRVISIALEPQRTLDTAEIRILYEREGEGRIFHSDELAIAWARGDPEQGVARPGDILVAYLDLGEAPLAARDVASVRILHPAGDPAYRAFTIPPLDASTIAVPLG